jgi:hypothetical protein
MRNRPVSAYTYFINEERVLGIKQYRVHTLILFILPTFHTLYNLYPVLRYVLNLTACSNHRDQRQRVALF